MKYGQVTRMLFKKLNEIPVVYKSNVKKDRPMCTNFVTERAMSTNAVDGGNLANTVIHVKNETVVRRKSSEGHHPDCEPTARRHCPHLSIVSQFLPEVKPT